MKLDADVDVINYFFKKLSVEKISQEELDEKRPNLFNCIWMQAWRVAEEYHRECQKKGITTEQDAINRNLRLS